MKHSCVENAPKCHHADIIGHRKWRIFYRVTSVATTAAKETKRGVLEREHVRGLFAISFVCVKTKLW